MTSANEIRRWFECGLVPGQGLNFDGTEKTHMIIWCDTYDYEDYPEYVNVDELPGKDVKTYVDLKNGENMRRLMEVYDLRLDMESQMAEHRALHY